MPNFCLNRLHVSSSNSNQLKEFIEKARGLVSIGARIEPSALCFNNFYPYPNNKSGSKKFFKNYLGFHNDNNWRRENWGTTSEALWVKIENQTSNLIIYSFSTAWEPPLPLLYTISTLFPDLSIEITYDEPGVGFHGFASFENGIEEIVDSRAIENNRHSISLTDLF